MDGTAGGHGRVGPGNLGQRNGRGWIAIWLFMPRLNSRGARGFYMAHPSPPASSPSHSPAQNSPAQLGCVHERLRPAPPINSTVSLHAPGGYARAGRWQFPPRHSLFTRCDRDGRARLWLRLRRSVLQLCKFLARHEDFSRSAAVCAAHQPQRVVRTGRRPIQPVPAGFRGRCGWSSADTAALLGLRFRRSVFSASRWFTCLGWFELLRLSAWNSP